MKNKTIIIALMLILGVCLYFFARSSMQIASNSEQVRIISWLAAVLGGLGLLFKGKFTASTALAIEWAAYVAPTSIMLAQLFTK